jgi:multiple sugar transport system substrate-binding protein
MNFPRSRTLIIRITALALAALTLAALAGCRQKKPDIVTIRFTSWGNDVEEVRLRKLIATFEKQHPNIKVEMEITPWPRMLDKLMISSAGGRPPDMARISSEWFYPIAAKGLLEPLDPYVKRDRYDLDDFYPQAIEGWGRYKGVLYEIPTDIDVHSLYYNKDMFDRCGQPYPDWTWDWSKLVEVAGKLTKDTDGDGRLDQWGYALDFWWQGHVYDNGGSILSDDLTKCTLDQPAEYEGLQFMSDLVNKYHVAPADEDAANLGTLKLFTNGKIGMIVSGSWAAELIFPQEIKDFTYDIAPMPKGAKSRATFIGGAAYAVLARSKHKEEAWELVKFMTGKEYQRDAAILSQIVPSRKSVAESGAYLKLPKPPKHRKVFLDMIEYGRANPGVPCAPEMGEIVGSELDLVRLGKESAEDACRKITPVIDELLRHKD